jgi:hypothetical protein
MPKAWKMLAKRVRSAKFFSTDRCRATRDRQFAKTTGANGHSQSTKLQALKTF